MTVFNDQDTVRARWTDKSKDLYLDAGKHRIEEDIPDGTLGTVVRKLVRDFYVVHWSNGHQGDFAARDLERAKMRFQPAREGDQFGCTDTAPPEDYTEYELSRLRDALRAAEVAGLDPKAVFDLAPSAMKLEFNYANWKYQGSNRSLHWTYIPPTWKW